MSEEVSKSAVKAAKTNKFAPISVVVMDPDGSEIVTKRMDGCPVGARLPLLSYIFDWFIPFAGGVFNLVTCPFIYLTRHATANGIGASMHMRGSVASARAAREKPHDPICAVHLHAACAPMVSSHTIGDDTPAA